MEYAGIRREVAAGGARTPSDTAVMAAAGAS